MKWPAMLIALLLPACGDGVSGVAVPPPLDMGHLVRPKTPNTALAAPEGFQPEPDILTRPYSMPAPALYAAANAMAMEQPRTYGLKTFYGQLQSHFVVRSAVFGFPDLVTLQVTAIGPDRSTLVIWSRSVYGYSDLGVNRKRVVAWLSALDAKGGR